MNAKARTARQTIKTRATDTRKARKAVRMISAGKPVTAKLHMAAAGIDGKTANRFAGAFSARQTPTLVSETRIKLKGRVTKAVLVKLYSADLFAARLAAYRPKDKAAAQIFERAAHRLAV